MFELAIVLGSIAASLMFIYLIVRTLKARSQPVTLNHHGVIERIREMARV